MQLFIWISVRLMPNWLVPTIFFLVAQVGYLASTITAHPLSKLNHITNYNLVIFKMHRIIIILLAWIVYGLQVRKKEIQQRSFFKLRYETEFLTKVMRIL